MKHNLEINLKEIIEYSSTAQERKDLLWWMFVDGYEEGEFNNVLKDILNDKLECELEFDNRDELIKAYGVLIEHLK